MRGLSAVIAVMLACAVLPARAQDTAVQTAAAAYREGRVQDAIAGLERAGGGAVALAEICINTLDAYCIRRNAKLFNDAKSGDAQSAARRFLFLVALERYLSGDNNFIVSRDGADFALKYADPIADPVLAARWFILNARMAQDSGDYGRARRHINRAFASWLRIPTGNGSYHSAVVLKELIKTVAASQDTARGLKMLTSGLPLMQSLSGYDRADLLLLMADAMAVGTRYDAVDAAYAEAHQAYAALQIPQGRKDAILSSIVIARAGALALSGRFADARQEFSKSPLKARRDAMLKAGAAASYGELYYIAAEIFFDRLTGNTPDARWQAVLAKTPDFDLGQQANAEMATYKSVAQAFLGSDPAAGRRLFDTALAGRFALFEKQRDISAFPLPSLLDRVLIGIGAQVWSSADGELLIRAMELSNRNGRYAASDALTVMAAQRNDEDRRAAQAVLRLTERQEAWEVGQIAQVVKRATDKQPDPKSWAAQFTAKDFDHALQRLQKGMRPANSQLPSLAELQGALGAGEAFVGFVSGKRVCLTGKGVWSETVFAPASGDGLSPEQQHRIDVKLLLASLTDQNAPSEARDSNFPVPAAMRLYRTLFGGFDACLAGARLVQVFAPNDIAAVPLAVLLKEAPPRLGSGYDLTKAHWLARDHAFAQVTSVRDFLSSRALARRQSGAVLLAGVGDPRLTARLGDGESGAKTLVAASGAVGLQSLRELKELPETATELKAIAGAVKGGGTILLAEQATEEHFRALPLAQYQMLHFATHGLIKGDVPGLEQPALVFTPKDMGDELNDGLLTASDIANLNLAARLVVLSACNTANFDPAAFNSQIQGLSSAFAVAGVPATVASLWPVESGTSARLMIHLYKHLLSADAPGIAVALQRATLDTIADAPSRAFAHPRFWAPFVSLGDGAARIEAAQGAARRSLVAVSDGGGEILGAAVQGDVVIMSEIGPRYNGKHASLLVARASDDRTLWTQEDREIGAGPVAALGDGVVAAGYRFEGRSVPVLRALGRDGKPRWRIEPKASFDNAVIAALATAKDAVFVVLMPLTGAYDSEVIRYDAKGVEQKRARIVGAPSAPGVTVSVVLDGETLVIAANRSGRELKPYKDDFAQISVCRAGGGADLYRLGAANLEARGEGRADNIAIARLTASGGRILFAGAELGACSQGEERPVLGVLSPALSATSLWRDDSVFAGRLAALMPTKRGVLAVGQVQAPLDFSTAAVDDAGKIQSVAQDDLDAKHPASLNNRPGAILLVEVDGQGKLLSRRILSSGLSLYPAGMVQAGADALVFGSSGFNPWLERIRP